MKKILIFLALFFLLPVPAEAIYFNSGDSLTLEKGKKIDETVFISGNHLTLDSDINGDLFCAGKDITVSGHVTGDVYCAGQNITLNGPVDGSVNLAGQYLTLNSAIAHNGLVAGQQLLFSKNGSVKGDLFAAGETLSLLAPVGRDLALAGSTVDVNSAVGRHAYLAGQSLNVGSTAKVAGNLNLYTEPDTTVKVADGVVKGSVNKYAAPTPTPTPEKEIGPLAAKVSGYYELFAVLSSLIIGLCLLYFVPRFTATTVNQIILHPLATFFSGFAFLLIIPLLFILLLITIVGLPLAFVLILIYTIGLLVATTYSSLAFGHFLLTITKARSSLFFSLVVGIILYRLLTFIPVIGWFVGFIFFCLGLGAFFQSFLPQKQPPVQA